VSSDVVVFQCSSYAKALVSPDYSRCMVSANIEECYMCRKYRMHLDRDRTEREYCGRCGEKLDFLDPDSSSGEGRQGV